MNKKFITVLLIIILTGFSGLVLGVSPERTERISDFIRITYREYGEAEFDRVYARLHPEIKNCLERERYREYQQEHYEQLQLEIKEVEVEEVNEIKELTPLLTELLNEIEMEYFEASIRYLAAFDTELGRQERELKKKVLIGIEVEEEEEVLYLLWDPSPVFEEEE
ncbi:MAG: hypothetical protein ACOCQH_01340 [Halanaerobiales bacterium]